MVKGYRALELARGLLRLPPDLLASTGVVTCSRLTAILKIAVSLGRGSTRLLEPNLALVKVTKKVKMIFGKLPLGTFEMSQDGSRYLSPSAAQLRSMRTQALVLMRILVLLRRPAQGSREALGVVLMLVR